MARIGENEMICSDLMGVRWLTCGVICGGLYPRSCGVIICDVAVWVEEKEGKVGQANKDKY